MEDRFENFTYLILKTSKLIQKIKTFEMEEYGLKAIDVMCIYALDKSNVGLTHKELVEKTLEDKGAISRALTLLKNKGIVTYDSNTYNNLIVLTPFGKEVAKHIYSRSKNALDKNSLDINDEERVILYKSLENILDNLETYYKSLTKNK